MSNLSFLSKKGAAASKSPMRIDLEIYYEAMENLYHPETNPSGALPMNVAENHLCWEMLRDRIQKVTRENTIPEWVASYTDPAGAPSFREATAEFLSKFLMHVPVNPDSLAFSGGATSTIEMTSFLLANPGDTAVIPAPSYPVYSGDIGTLPEVKRFDLQVPSKPINSEYQFDLQLLQEAKEKIEANGSNFRMLILTQPDNPTGRIYSESLLRKIADWCIQNQIHLIVNEIYGLSQLDIQNPNLKAFYPQASPFVSFGKIMSEYQSPFLHFWYSFSKDFGISGFRIGLLHSHNEDLIQAYRNAGLGHSISNYTQWVIQEVLLDHGFLKTFFESFQQKLTESYLIVTQTLKKLNIPFNPSRGSLFVWMDLSEFLEEKSLKGEEKLWLEIYEKTGILITPTNGFGHSEKGWYRIVITSLSHEELKVAMKRLSDFIQIKRKG
ncbi:aminotransferase class I/II-fold pyridoxal phosphate-dependent enzyme [Algoriphagus kandeliae]|uniref:Aminotransferase n=1 Tax=Algoriphagus kandeliae TaxID=2562278 RepID=A0A4Y9QTL6_9BACT|nr:aminotransferase class I/II-fold pyridoxal phosphate-dependent enzyme [Algoriphagus kandeliae]TFV94543.1 aminotransferase class I/II-fold pyridoxal phosphate-dependent enzyme [Algoriphagus kandeliae]